MTASYRFLPWVRRGAVGSVHDADPLDGPLPARAALDVVLTVRDTGAAAGEVRPDLRVLGPGDVTGLAPGAVAAVRPSAGAGSADVEAFPAVELHDPDLPWLLTPAAPDGRGRLRPWLCLVVLSGAEGPPRVRPGDGGRLPSVVAPTAQLPDLAESWAWAHAQVVVEDDEDVLAVLAGAPERARSRLLCPQRVAPHRRYVACVVPTTDAGRRSGLGLDVDDDALAHAWTRDDGPTVELPVYHHWSFTTGARGDVEQLLEQLVPRPLPPGVGTRTVRLVDQPDGLPDPGPLHLGGALTAADEPPADEDALDAWAEAFRRWLDAGRHDEAPVVAPPVYGARQAGEPGLPAAGDEPRWLAELATDPRHRAAAGLGALVVQLEQAELVAETWRQAGAVEDAERVVRQGELARETGRGVHRRHVRRLPAGELFLLTGPVHGRTTTAPGTTTSAGPAPAAHPTVRERTRLSPMPRATTSPQLRRALRAVAPTVPAVAGRDDGDAVADVGGSTFLDGLADGSLSPRPARPGRDDLDDGDHVDDPAAGDPDPLPPGLEQPVEADRERLLHLAALAGAASAPAAAGPSLPVADVAAALRDDLDPDRTVDRAVAARVYREDEDAGDDAPRPVDDRAPRLLAAPVLRRPAYRSLTAVSEDLLLPGLADVPDETVTLVGTNPRFVEAFLVGLNHELSRELLWREVPVDLRATAFRWFWPPGPDDGDGGRGRDIGAWDGTRRLGTNHPDATGGARAVVLVRGELVRRYPGTEVLAARAVRDDVGVLVPGDDEREPVFGAGVEPDVLLVGLDLTVDEARGDDGGDGWFVVLQQPVDDARFGLDPPAGEPGGSPGSWDELSWDHLAADGAPPAPGSHVAVPGPLGDLDLDGAEWGLNSAHLARATLQRPLRLAVHAADLVPAPGGGPS